METSWLSLFSRPDTLALMIPFAALMIPVVAIVVGGIVAIAKLLIRHRERMTMIEHGIHPDYQPEELPEDGEMAE